MIKVKSILYKLSTKINDLPVSSRWFIVAIFVALMYAVNLMLNSVFTLNEIDNVKKKGLEFNNNTNQFKIDLQTLKDLAHQPEKILLENDIIEIERKIIEVNEEIELITRLLIDPKTMTQLLDNIIRKQSQLTLISLKSIDHIKQEELGLYQHQIEIKLEGDYIVIARYLHDLEAMPFKVYWKNIEYKSLNVQGQAPNASVVLTIYTLSRQGGWLGV
ncbi:MAG: hypothetical protein HRU38_00075 [Saccharospirillaceae bacterium]|nr:hypothetical protein [Pseudomonadales bacterium]NRB77058.1 hypothetical protein [Saccharospirillaceae bacterium]